MTSIAMMKKAIAMGLGLVCCAHGRAAGAVLRVPADFPTIQAAVAAAADGDVVLVAPGRYSEVIAVQNKRITVRGEAGAEQTTLDGSGLSDGMVRFSRYSPEEEVGVLEGFTLTNARHRALSVNGRATIRACVFIDNSLPATPLESGSALDMAGDSRVIDCAFIANDHAAVAMGGSAVSFLRCRFERNPDRAVVNIDGSPTFTDCRFAGNRSTGDGGAIYNTNTIGVTEPKFIGCEFIGNVAGAEPELSDGGVFWGFNASLPTFIDCRFERNRAANGGVIRSMGPTETFIDCTFIANSAYWGGVLYRLSGSATHVERCLFEDNTADYAGAIVLNHAASGGEPSIIDSVFRGNTANSAGAIALEFGSLTIANCVFDGNTSTHQGSAMFVYNASARLVNCTFARNTAGDAWKGAPASGAIHLFFDATATLENSICWNNLPGQIVTERTSDAVVNHSLIEGGWIGGTGNLDADPKFRDLASGDVRLRQDSPAIDAGDNSSVPASLITDIDGLDRITDGDADGEARVDLGAHEFSRSCAADLVGGDGVVDDADLLALIAAWGECADCGRCPADLAPASPDCQVNVTDLLAMVMHWGACN